MTGKDYVNWGTPSTGKRVRQGHAGLGEIITEQWSDPRIYWDKHFNQFSLIDTLWIQAASKGFTPEPLLFWCNALPSELQSHTVRNRSNCSVHELPWKGYMH